MILKNGTFLNDQFRFEKGDIQIRSGIIAKVGRAEDESEETMDCSGAYIVPGLVDIHTHGCLGHDFSDAPFPTDMETMTRFYASHGVTTVLATTETLSPEQTVQAVRAAAEASHKKTAGANIEGIHMEGPYLSAKYKGAQNEAHLRLPDLTEFRRLNEACGFMLRRISIAPELIGAMEFIREVSREVSVSIGHTDADYDTAREAITAGADSMTHTFNAMRPLLHRQPNAVGAALEHELFCEFIGDGFHIAPTILTLMYRILGDRKMLFVSDSIRACGMTDGLYELGGLPVTVKDGKARLSDGTIAGSTVTLMDCAQNAIAYGIPPESAFRMCSLTPAKAARIDSRCGSITPGKRADLLILRRDFSLEQVMVCGEFFNE